MKKSIKKILSIMIVSMFLLNSLNLNALAFTTKIKKYEINTIKELKHELKNINKKERDNPAKQIALVEKTSPEIIGKFMQEKGKIAVEKLK